MARQAAFFRRPLYRTGARSATGRRRIRSNPGDGMRIIFFWVIVLQLAPFGLRAQTPDFTGAWSPNRGGKGTDPKLAPPAAGPLLLKPEYAKPYEERRALEAEANKRG